MHKLKAGLNELETSLKDEYLQRSDSPDSVIGYNDHVSHRPIPTEINMPDILLLTVAQTPKDHYELFVSIPADISPVHSWLRHDDKPSLDGVYLQYQPEMHSDSGIAALRSLSNQYQVGIWCYYGDPDCVSTATSLVRDCGVSFVNTDLPRNFGRQ